MIGISRYKNDGNYIVYIKYIYVFNVQYALYTICNCNVILIVFDYQ